MKVETEEEILERLKDELDGHLQDALAKLRDPNAETLDVSNIIFGKVHFDAIAAELPNSNIRHLKIGRQFATNDNVETLLDTLPQCPNLESFSVDGGCLREKALIQLTEIIPQTNISALSFDAYSPPTNYLGADQFEPNYKMCDFIDMLPNSQVTDLKFSTQNFGDKEAEHMAEVLKQGKITKLDIPRSVLEEAGTAALFSALPHSRLIEFGLNSGVTNPDNAKILAEALPHASLTKLELRSCKFFKGAASILFEALPESQIEKLDISGNQIRADGAQALAIALPKTRIHWLNIGNTYCVDGFDAIAEALPNTRLETLYLHSNGLSVQHIETLANALPQSSLRTLGLSYNQFNNAGATAIANALPTSGLTYLMMADCGMGEKGAKAMAEALPKTQLGYLDMRNQYINAEGAHALAQAVPQSRLGHLECYSGDDEEQQKSTKAIYAHAYDNKIAAHKLAYKLLSTPQEMQAEDWQKAADTIGTLRFVVDQEWKYADGTPVKPSVSDAMLAKAFFDVADAHPELVRDTLLKILPYDIAKEALSSVGQSFTAKDLLDDQGHFPETSILRSGAQALFNDPAMWDSVAQARTAHASLPEAQQEHIGAMHQLNAVLSRKDMGTGHGR